MSQYKSPQKSSNEEHCVHVMEFVDRCFGEAFEFAFISGSRANGKWNENSDVDIFVVLGEGITTEQELTFYNLFIEYHNKHGLHHDHCGELLHRQTLDYLLAICSRTYTKIPGIKKSCCYSCLFSEYRKGRVIMGMLKDPKLMERGNLHLVSHYRSLSEEYFRLETKDRESDGISGPQICPRPDGVPYQQIYQSQIDMGDYWSTPVGIRLDKWFSDGSFERNRSFESITDQCILNIALEHIHKVD